MSAWDEAAKFATRARDRHEELGFVLDFDQTLALAQVYALLAISNVLEGVVNAIERNP